MRCRGPLSLQLGWALKHVAGNFSFSLFSPHPHQPSHGNLEIPTAFSPSSRLVSPSAHPPPPPPPLTAHILLPSIDGETEKRVFSRLSAPLPGCPAALPPPPNLRIKDRPLPARSFFACTSSPSCTPGGANGWCEQHPRQLGLIGSVSVSPSRTGPRDIGPLHPADPVLPSWPAFEPRHRFPTQRG